MTWEWSPCGDQRCESGQAQPSSYSGGVYFANQFNPAREGKCRQLECMLLAGARSAQQFNPEHRQNNPSLSLVIREKNQRLEVVRGMHSIDQFVFLTPNDANPACDGLLLARLVDLAAAVMHSAAHCEPV